MMAFKRIRTFAAFILFNAFLGIVTSTSEPWSPEKEARAKANYCNELKDKSLKLPSKYSEVYKSISNVQCKDSSKSIWDIEEYLKQVFTDDERKEIQILVYGKSSYCDFTLGLQRLYSRKELGQSEEASNVTTPEYHQLKEICADPSKTKNDLIPIAQKLSKIYFHF